MDHAVAITKNGDVRRVCPREIDDRFCGNCQSPKTVDPRRSTGIIDRDGADEDVPAPAVIDTDGDPRPFARYL
jgi:hypothetical protein